jgi:hypothetical protein
MGAVDVSSPLSVETSLKHSPHCLYFSSDFFEKSPNCFIVSFLKTVKVKAVLCLETTLNFCLLAAFSTFGKRFRRIILLSVCQIGENWRREVHIAHETAICRNPPIHNFAGVKGWT